jgi:hypothetical protein
MQPCRKDTSNPDLALAAALMRIEAKLARAAHTPGYTTVARTAKQLARRVRPSVVQGSLFASLR